MRAIARTAVFFLMVFLAACTFDYGEQESADANQPDIVMENVEYVRVKSGDPITRFKAEWAARYEERQLMEMRHLSFEQFGNHGEDTNAFGRIGQATAEIDTNNIVMNEGVRIEVKTENIIIETQHLEWKDKERLLVGGEGNEVNILRENGTFFTGIGFNADARRRIWEFSGGVRGTYVHDDEEEETKNE